MKNKIVLLVSVLAVMVLSVVSVYGITGQSVSVEKAYAAVIPSNAFLITSSETYSGTSYDIYFDISVSPSFSFLAGAFSLSFSARTSSYRYSNISVVRTSPADSSLNNSIYSSIYEGSVNTRAFFYSNSSWGDFVTSDGGLLHTGHSFEYISLGSYSTYNDFIYLVPKPTYVTQSTTVEFDTTQIDSLTFDGISFSTTGQSQEITYDNEDGVYSLSVVSVNGYKPVSASVTYLSDSEGDLPAVYDFVNNQVNINCPVGDAVTSITIESEVLSVYVRCYFQTWQPNVEDNVTGAIDYGGSSGSLILPNFTFSFLDGAFLDYLELWDYAFSFVNSSSMLFDIRQYNLVGVSYYDGTPVSFPLSVSNYDSSKGGIIFLTKRIMSSVSFSAPSAFAYVDSVEGAFPFPLGGYNYLTTYVYSVSPYALSSNLDWHIVVQNAYFPTSVGESDTEIHLYIDNQLIDYFVCPLSFNAGLKFIAINMSPVSSYLSDLSNSNGIVYYLDNVIYVTSTSTNVTELYFSSNKSSWSPSFLDAFSYLGQVFDNVFEIMEINITRDMTLGTILLIVLSLGVLMFLFRMGGIF